MFKYEHICGTQGFGLKIGDVCSACMMRKLYQEGQTGADLSPGNHVSEWAHKEILDLQGVVNKLLDRINE